MKISSYISLNTTKYTRFCRYFDVKISSYISSNDIYKRVIFGLELFSLILDSQSGIFTKQSGVQPPETLALLTT